MLPSSFLPASSQDGDAVLFSKPQNFIFTKNIFMRIFKTIIPQYYFPYKFPVSAFKELQKIKLTNALSLIVSVVNSYRMIEVGTNLQKICRWTPLLKQSHLEAAVQTVFEYLRRWWLHNLSGLVLSYSHREKVFPDVQKEPPVF